MVEVSDLILAWRKAKVDLYYSTNPRIVELAEYEDNLIKNLTNLQSCINGDSDGFISDPDFLGTWTLSPKSINWLHKKNDQVSNKAMSMDTTVIFASPQDEWMDRVRAGQKPVAEFRLMALCSIDFHVFSTLWMMKVGHLFDQPLSENVYGSRLRRTAKGDLNEMSLGSFKPYLKPFRNWRDGAIKAMHDALADKQDVIALTADVSSFYHRLDPSFMLDPSFHERAGVSLDEPQQALHELFITALSAWAARTPMKTGLPVGLPASAVVANAALVSFDRFIERQIVPLYYGRYVDDILLVMHNTTRHMDSDGFWAWVAKRSDSELQLDVSGKCVRFKPDYLENSDIVFQNTKNKLFVLSGGPGLALVNSIREQIDQRSSEWRALPDLPGDPENVATDLLKATNHAGEHADNLRKTDALTLHRAGFALNLRDYEAFERDLPPAAWQTHRHAFLNAVIDHLLTPVKYFELEQYMPRIFRMAVSCQDFEHLGKMLERMEQLETVVQDECEHKIKGIDSPRFTATPHLELWRISLARLLIESILSAMPRRLSKASQSLWEQYVADQWRRIARRLWGSDGVLGVLPVCLKDLHKKHAWLFGHDLAHMPFRFAGLPREMVGQRGIVRRGELHGTRWTLDTSPAMDEAAKTLAKWFKPKLRELPAGLFFATRPFTISELYLIVPDPFGRKGSEDIRNVLSALRGFSPETSNLPRWDKHQRMLVVPEEQSKERVTIAVASWSISDASFEASVSGKIDSNVLSRYQRMNRLVNEIIYRSDHAKYLIFPELALPPRWFMRVATKLSGRRISLVTGVEYIHARKRKVRNQIWASLTHDGLGFPSVMLYRQDKQTPAIHEEQELFRIAGAALCPKINWKKSVPPVLKHGDFYFALLVCSELTNIQYRACLRGKIDALFVPEWNSDTETFNALVESAALDMHAYIVQCNNRRYGDSRTRAPYKDRWRRDILRVKGGNHDYCITGELDVHALREFQSSYRSPNEPFKPVPDGFDIDYSREML